MERVLLDEVVFTDYGQFDLGWGDGFGFDGDADRYFAGQVNGLVGAARANGVYLHFGRRSGGSPVRIVLIDEAPGESGSSWEDVVEVSIDVPSGTQVRWVSWHGDGGVLDGVGAGEYRLRVSARGRDAGHDGEFADGPVDAYLLQLWPAPARPDAILRVGSSDAEYWHREWGSRRPVS
ncbi:hypothetical protein [Kribbella sp. NPDC004875]|uniref:hypothetical protein n=1 Tax=Kribbella sp. NPDC004875 TaxID=3364107 RepID=UPI00368E33C4